MFSEEEIYTLFSNIEEIYAFHKKLLAQMKNCYVKDDPCASQIGAVFLANVSQGLSLVYSVCLVCFVLSGHTTGSPITE